MSELVAVNLRITDCGVDGRWRASDRLAAADQFIVRSEHRRNPFGVHGKYELIIAPHGFTNG